MAHTTRAMRLKRDKRVLRRRLVFDVVMLGFVMGIAIALVIFG